MERGASYDDFVDWDARLDRELPFFRTLFAERGVRRVIDAGCGSGQHSIAFAREGFEVAAFDPSEEMRDQALANAAEAGVSLSIMPGTFEAAPCVAASVFHGPADAVLTLGNGLPHVEGAEGLRRALDAFGEALRPGGLLVIHLLNHARLLRTRVRALPPKVRETERGTFVFLRLVDYVDPGIAIEFVTLTRRAGALSGDATSGDDTSADWKLVAHRGVHTAMPEEVLRPALDEAGFDVDAVYGGHDRHPLDPERDESLIVVATKR